ncbi:hypothetical protein BU17DRAFT_72259 [Hysterangium stoloniferum]|nr:hypothetical protein BU17DRAFT_72259 [Hysterangium stoloniferum]
MTWDLQIRGEVSRVICVIIKNSLSPFPMGHLNIVGLAFLEYGNWRRGGMILGRLRGHGKLETENGYEGAIIRLRSAPFWHLMVKTGRVRQRLQLPHGPTFRLRNLLVIRKQTAFIRTTTSHFDPYMGDVVPRTREPPFVRHEPGKMFMRRRPVTWMESRGKVFIPRERNIVDGGIFKNKTGMIKYPAHVQQLRRIYNMDIRGSHDSARLETHSPPREYHLIIPRRRGRKLTSAPQPPPHTADRNTQRHVPPQWLLRRHAGPPGETAPSHQHPFLHPNPGHSCSNRHALPHNDAPAHIAYTAASAPPHSRLCQYSPAQATGADTFVGLLTQDLHNMREKLFRAFLYHSRESLVTFSNERLQNPGWSALWEYERGHRGGMSEVIAVIVIGYRFSRALGWWLTLPESGMGINKGGGSCSVRLSAWREGDGDSMCVWNCED